MKFYSEVKLRMIFCDSDRSKGSVCSETKSVERYWSHKDQGGRTEAKDGGIWNVSFWRICAMLNDASAKLTSRCFCFVMLK